MRGYHVYKDIWEANVGEELECVRERRNEKDRYAVAVVKNDTIIGHLPRKISKVCSFFFKKRRQLMLYSNWSEKILC